MAGPAEALKPPSIYIVGAQCTGKTSVVRELKGHFQTIAPGISINEPQIISEVARTVLAKHPIPTEKIRSDRNESLRLQKLILEAQATAEREALHRGSWFITDRSGFDPIVYAKRYVGQGAAEEMMQSEHWLELKGRMLRSQSLIVVFEAGVAWLENDGVRLMPEDREDWMRFHQLFCEVLDEAGLTYHVLPSTLSSLSKRTGFVLSKWEEMFNARMMC